MKSSKTKKVTPVLKKKSAVEKKIEFDSNIESNELIGEIHTKSYEMLRIHRIKFKGEPYFRINLRFWQFDPSDLDGLDYTDYDFEKFPTRRGCVIPESQFKELIKIYLEEKEN